MEAFVINLLRRPDRLERVSQRFKSVGISITPFPAVDAESLTLESSPMLTTLGFQANWQSHHSVLDQVADGEDEYAYIFEDDAVPNGDLDWTALTDALPESMSRLKLGYLQIGFISHYYGLTLPGIEERLRLQLHRNQSTSIQLDRKRKVNLGSSLMGTHAYVVSRDFARKISNLNSPCWVASDLFFSLLATQSDACGLFPVMGRLNSSIVEQETRINRGQQADSDVSKNEI